MGWCGAAAVWLNVLFEAGAAPAGPESSKFTLAAPMEPPLPSDWAGRPAFEPLRCIPAPQDAAHAGVLPPPPAPTGNRFTLAQLSALTSLHSLHSLDLEGNPAAEKPTYRAQTFEMLAVLPHFAVVDELNKQGERPGGLCPLSIIQRVAGAPPCPHGAPPAARHPCRRLLDGRASQPDAARHGAAGGASGAVDSRPARGPRIQISCPRRCPSPCR